MMATLFSCHLSHILRRKAENLKRKLKIVPTRDFAIFLANRPDWHIYSVFLQSGLNKYFTVNSEYNYEFGQMVT